MRVVADGKCLYIDHYEEGHVFSVWDDKGKYYGYEFNSENYPQASVVEYDGISDLLWGIIWGKGFYEKIKEGIRDEELKSEIENWMKRAEDALIKTRSGIIQGMPAHEILYRYVAKQDDEHKCPECGEVLQFTDYGWLIRVMCEKHGTLADIFIEPQEGKEMEHFPSIEVRCPERLKQAISHARKNNQMYSLLECFQLREIVSRNYQNGTCVLTEDFAPLSFAFLHLEDGQPRYNGGIIYHGEHDGNGSGSAPTFSVTMDDATGWRCHT